MTILVGSSDGTIRDALLALGLDAISCDLVPSRSPGPHIIGDVRLVASSNQWTGAFFYAPTERTGFDQASVAGALKDAREEAFKYFRWLMARPYPKVIFGQIGLISRLIRPHDAVNPETRECLWHDLPFPVTFGDDVLTEAAWQMQAA